MSSVHITQGLIGSDITTRLALSPPQVMEVSISGHGFRHVAFWSSISLRVPISNYLDLIQAGCWVPQVDTNAHPRRGHLRSRPSRPRGHQHHRAADQDLRRLMARCPAAGPGPALPASG